MMCWLLQLNHGSPTPGPQTGTVLEPGHVPYWYPICNLNSEPDTGGTRCRPEPVLQTDTGQHWNRMRTLPDVVPVLQTRLELGYWSTSRTTSSSNKTPRLLIYLEHLKITIWRHPKCDDLRMWICCIDTQINVVDQLRTCRCLMMTKKRSSACWPSQKNMFLVWTGGGADRARSPPAHKFAELPRLMWTRRDRVERIHFPNENKISASFCT